MTGDEAKITAMVHRTPHILRQVKRKKSTAELASRRRKIRSWKRSISSMPPRPPWDRAHVGVVGSGDLEVLIEPSDRPTSQVAAHQRRWPCPGLESGARPVLRELCLCGERRDQRLRGDARHGGAAARTGCRGGAVMTPTTPGDNPRCQLHPEAKAKDQEGRDRILSRRSVIEMRGASGLGPLSIPAAFANCSARSTGWNPPGCRCRASCLSPMTASSSSAARSAAGRP